MVFLRDPALVLCCFEPEEHVGCLECRSDIIINIVVWKASNILYCWAVLYFGHFFALLCAWVMISFSSFWETYRCTKMVLFFWMQQKKNSSMWLTSNSCLKRDRCFYLCHHRLIFVNLLMEAVHQTHLWKAHIRSPAATKPQTKGPFRKLQTAVFAWEVV